MGCRALEGSDASSEKEFKKKKKHTHTHTHTHTGHAKNSRRDLYKMHMTLMSFGAKKCSLSFSSPRLQGFGHIRE